MKNSKMWIFLLLITFALAACSNEEPKEFSDLYKGEMKEITKIQIVDGGSGYSREITSPKMIEELTTEITELTFTPVDTNGEQLFGLLYGVSFFEKNSENPIFTVSTNMFNDEAYKPNKDLGPIFKKYYNLGNPLN